MTKSTKSSKTKPATLADLSVASCRKKMDLIAKALDGHYREEHVFALQQSYKAYEFFHEQIDKCEKKIQHVLHAIQAKDQEVIEENNHQNRVKILNPRRRIIGAPITSMLQQKSRKLPRLI